MAAPLQAMIVLLLVAACTNFWVFRNSEMVDKNRQSSRALASATSPAGDVVLQQNEAVLGLVAWAKTKGGFLDPRVEIRRVDPQDPTSYFGAFLNKPVSADEKLIFLPGAIKLQLSKEESHISYEKQVCMLAWKLQTEYEKGEQSSYFPYIQYIKA